ncbi:conserved hypothetical protein [Arthrobacter sp. 9AX]|uniref:hypothetical protein n=1 Tax=Arthrobacter sp. 9AX TaxID=2653131 RepID=UPI0012F3BE6F|nr:hypothetical protein [Arthrobacter sp. 9AX]VXC17646.1 conserved hypothetical protein [Arthrobacter sp. 9AX]
MTINSPDSLPEDEPRDGAEGSRGKDDGGIPGGADGVGIGAGGEPNTFEPEEDPDATDGSETD